MVTDDDIIKRFVNSDTNKIISVRINKNHINDIPEYKEYLDNRYPKDEFVSYTFVVQRILNKVETLPICRKCGKKIFKLSGKWCSTKCQLTDEEFIKERNAKVNKELAVQRFHETCIKRYGVSVPAKSPEIYNKVKCTNLERYGTEYTWNSPNIQCKIKATNLERYGVENGGGSEQALNKIKQTKMERYGDSYYTNRDKAKQTFNEKYGCDSYMHTKEFVEQSKQTKLEKYGNPYYVNNEKSKQTCLAHFGVDNWGKTKMSKDILSSHEIVLKRNETKRKNGTFNTSKPEDETGKLLLAKYPNTLRNYKSEEYPFLCDFYIPELNLYIECNYHWTHNNHLYDENNEEDKIIVEKWKSYNTKYYNNAIDTWTIRDVKKHNLAMSNKLNYLVFYNINDFKKWINDN